MANKKSKIAILAGIGAVVGIGVAFLAAVGLGKKKGCIIISECSLHLT